MRLRAAAPVVALAAVLLVCMNGPVLFLARHVVDRPYAGWEDQWVRPFFVAVAWSGPLLLATVLVPRALQAGRSDPDQRTGGFRPTIPWPVFLVAAHAGLALWSTTWSAIPELTWMRAWIYVGMVPLAWWIATLSFEQLRTGILLASGAAVAVSLVLVAWWPELGRMEDGSWQGVFTNRNSLAPVAALAIAAGAFDALCRRGVRRIVGGALVGAGLVALAATGNRTSAFALLAGFGSAGAVVAVRRVRDRYGRTPASLAAAGVAVTGILGAAGLWSRLADTSTIKTRRLIWDMTLDLVEQRPWRGFGFFVLWDDPVLTRIPYERIGTPFGSAHNSGLESMLGTGPLGLTLFLAVALVALTGSLRSLWRIPTMESGFWAVLTVFLLAEHLTESFVLNFSYNWLLVSAAAVRVGLPGIGARACESVSAGGAAEAAPDEGPGRRSPAVVP